MASPVLTEAPELHSLNSSTLQHILPPRLAGRRRPSDTAQISSFFKNSLASVLLSLALAYLIWNCYEYLSIGSSLNVRFRSLAAGGFDDNWCLGNGNSGEEATAPDTSDAKEAADQARGYVEGPEAFGHHPAAQAWPRRAGRTPPGWGLRTMPPEWEGRVRVAFFRLQDVANCSAALIRFLTPKQAIHLVLHLTTLATVELSGLAYIPDPIQVPPKDEMMAPQKYKMKLVTFLALTKNTADVLKRLLFELLPIIQQSSTLPSQHSSEQQVTIVISCVQALAQIRKKQLLGDTVLRRWLVTCHRNYPMDNLMYTPAEYDQANAGQRVGLDELLGQVNAAAVEATGNAKWPEFSGTASASRQRSPLAAPSDLPPSSIHGPHGFLGGPSRIGPGQRGQEVAPGLPCVPDTTFRASLYLAQLLERPQQPAASQYEAVGALPRTHQRSSDLVLAAEGLGWGPMTAPPAILESISALFRIMERAPKSCVRLIPSLRPEVAADLAVSVGISILVELASLAYIPAEVQQGRQTAGRAVLGMLQSALDSTRPGHPLSGTIQTQRLLNLQNLTAEVCRKPEPESFTSRQYLIYLTSSWRLSNLSTKKVDSILKVTLYKNSAHGPQSPVVQDAMNTINAISQVRLRQVLREPRTRRWLTTCQWSAAPGFLVTPEEFDEATRSRSQNIRASMTEVSVAAASLTMQDGTAQLRMESSEFLAEGHSPGRPSNSQQAAGPGVPPHLSFQPLPAFSAHIQVPQPTAPHACYKPARWLPSPSHSASHWIPSASPVPPAHEPGSQGSSAPALHVSVADLTGFVEASPRNFPLQHPSLVAPPPPAPQAQDLLRFLHPSHHSMPPSSSAPQPQFRPHQQFGPRRQFSVLFARHPPFARPHPPTHKGPAGARDSQSAYRAQGHTGQRIWSGPNDSARPAGEADSQDRGAAGAAGPPQYLGEQFDIWGFAEQFSSWSAFEEENPSED
ncbi:hypothetical protein Efla_001606 [Eimeria flavescens]